MVNDQQAYVVTIDGPGGSGKGSLALHVAKTLGFHLLDSGAIYRLLALKATRMGIDLDDEDALTLSFCLITFDFLRSNWLFDIALARFDRIDSML